MMNWHQQSNDTRRGRRRMLIATFVVLLLILFDIWSGGGLRAPLRTAAVYVSIAARSVFLWTADIPFFSSRRALQAENESLRAALDSLEERAALLAVAREENEALRALVSLADSERGITVPVVSSLRASPYGTFFIGAGEDGGVTEGDRVLSGSGFVIGEVAEVASGNALVRTVLASGNTVNALMGGVSVAVEAKGGGNARALAPRSVSISIGDVVVAPEYGGRPIGVVGEIVSESGDATQELYIRLPVNLEAMRFVYVVKN